VTDVLRGFLGLTAGAMPSRVSPGGTVGTWQVAPLLEQSRARRYVWRLAPPVSEILVEPMMLELPAEIASMGMRARHD
jgi:hypothetical protein